MAPPSTVAFIVFSIFSIFLYLIPSPWHWKVRNTATLMLIGWGTVGNLLNGVNAAIFANTSENVAPGWCDFSGMILCIWPCGMAGSSLCLLRRLEAIASTRQVSYTKADRRRRTFIDLGIGIGIPLMIIPLRVVVQGHRMNIVGGYGCFTPAYYSWLYIFIFQIWWILLSLASLVYACLTLRSFYIRRRQFNAILQTSSSGISKDKYIRLMLMTINEMVASFPITIYTTIVGPIRSNQMQHYTSWADVHFQFNKTWSFDGANFDKASIVLLELTRWYCVLSAIIFFSFFGFTTDLRQEYASAFNSTLSYFKRVPKRGSNLSSIAEIW
ncbi:fungal pheromone STE3G-protein-coupled receptor [Violaceomyces palustris]|uniref:Fungal pheromone STE3G-protein-coupled receptor n=1 Tax=Violaceomyces palustris TaxID=1673888 RepID=A0ACD0NYQ6_9BASI|nr:fungal pheromone STE3G-protein-coupled receptor [Violaceomyces palustris]